MNDEVRQTPARGSAEPQAPTDCRLFQFEGDLRADHVEGLEAFVEGQSVNVLLDCHRVRAFDEAALDALVALNEQVSHGGGKMVLVGMVHPKLSHVLFLDAPHAAHPPQGAHNRASSDASPPPEPSSL